MLISLTITIAAAIGMLALIVGAYWLATRTAQAGGISVGSWRWFPSPIALLLLVPLAGFLLWRFSPALIIIPFILPFFLRRGFGGPFLNWTRRNRRTDDDERPPDNG